jgi:hypothetical protein
MIKKSFGKHLTAGVLTDIYTVPEGARAEWTLLYVTNPGSNNKTIEIDYYNAETDTTLIILDGYIVNAKDYLKLGGGATDFIILKEGDKIKAQGEAGSNFSVLISVIEHNNIVQNI